LETKSSIGDDQKGERERYTCCQLQICGVTSGPRTWKGRKGREGDKVERREGERE